jgi:hypothetical protein
MTTAEAPRRRRLSRADVERLLDRSSVETRVETMAVLVGELDGGTLEGNERRLALEILHCFAGDAEVAVREAVAWQIHNSPLLTPDLADRLDFRPALRGLHRAAVGSVQHPARR